ncbi:A disintegrin and metalloproteinase with thrombospondin motifs like [Littorina saxatilis]|uniref:A disintegrin and metalloproteinase with thrombospondin motifs like n=1 Tax=Littorina saxatilis TaxID=31220 RepID=UPI0038B42B54
MSGSGNYSFTDPKRLNKWKFSSCSIKYFDDFIKQNLDSSKGAHCLYSSYNTSSEVPDVGTLMPGQVYDADEQCRQIYGQSSYLCQSFRSFEWNLSMVCSSMWCAFGEFCHGVGFSARGTTCGDGMWCIDGQCQPNTSTSVMPSPTTTSPTTATTTTSITPTPTSSSTMASMEHSSMVPATPAATTTLPSSEATTTASLTSMTSTSAATDGSGCLTSSVALLVAGCIASLLTYLKHFVQ